MNDTILKQAIDVFGHDSRYAVAAGEIGELLNLYGKRAEGRDDPDAWIDEIADVTIMMRQLALMHGVDKVERCIQVKMWRLDRLIQDAL